MRAEDLRLEELVSFSDGLVSLHGRRLVLHDVRAMAQLRKDLVDTLGTDQSRRILARFGYFWGEADASALKRIVKWDTPTEWLRAGPQLHRLQGVADVELKELEVGSDGSFRMVAVWHNSAEAEEQLAELGESPGTGCWICQGYASGYASFCLGKPVYFMEKTCRGRGDRECVAIGKDKESWGDEAESLGQRFQADDIRNKVESLTAELHKKTLELARKQKKLKQVEALAVPGAPEMRSKSFHQVLDASRRVARFDSSVLITGESGVGKEVIARFVHDKSHRQTRPFVAINCGALPETLLESELFGHKSGSFTGAIRDRAGLFEQAQHGTILLDEIGEISPSLQVTLLRVLEEKEIRRVGENINRKIDVRVIAATNRVLETEIKEGRFRDDLFYRLRVVEIRIPPLRERREDILALARYFTERLQKSMKLPRLMLDPSCLQHLERYPWPGNVRELENAIERAAIMSEDGWIRPVHLPSGIVNPGSIETTGEGGGTRTLADVERGHVLTVLESVNGNRTRASKILGISTTTLWRKLKEWGQDG